MIAKNFVSVLIPPLKHTDSGDKALGWMADFHVRHLPVVEDGKFKGVISEDDILDFNQPDAPLSDYPIAVTGVSVKEHDHLYEIAKTAVNSQLTVVPVVDTTHNLLGVITLDALLAYLAQGLSMTEVGSILVLEVKRQNYSLAEIARIAEFERASILSTMISTDLNAPNFEVTLKLNTSEIQHLVATYERFGYEVKASFHESDYLEDLQERYDSFLNYLNI